MLSLLKSAGRHSWQFTHSRTLSLSILNTYLFFFLHLKHVIIGTYCTCFVFYTFIIITGINIISAPYCGYNFIFLSFFLDKIISFWLMPSFLPPEKFCLRKCSYLQWELSIFDTLWYIFIFTLILKLITKIKITLGETKSFKKKKSWAGFIFEIVC